MWEEFSQVSGRGRAGHEALKGRKEHSRSNYTRWLTKLPHLTLPWLMLRARLSKQFLAAKERELRAHSMKATERGALRV